LLSIHSLAEKSSLEFIKIYILFLLVLVFLESIKSTWWGMPVCAFIVTPTDFSSYGLPATLLHNTYLPTDLYCSWTYSFCVHENWRWQWILVVRFVKMKPGWVRAQFIVIVWVHSCNAEPDNKNV
jgi:hypothetical protein